MVELDVEEFDLDERHDEAPGLLTSPAAERQLVDDDGPAADHVDWTEHSLGSVACSRDNGRGRRFVAVRDRTNLID